MDRTIRRFPALPADRATLRILLMSAFALLPSAGCSRDKPAAKKAVSEIPTVEVTKPDIRTIVREVGQPSFIEAYEQTAIYAKLPAYVEKWNVDIGNRVKKGDILATLFIPELVQEFEQKKAMLKQDLALVDQAKQLVVVAEAYLKSAESQVKEAVANVGKSQALVTRWDSEVARLTTLVRDRVVDKQILTESERQLQSNQAMLLAAQAAVETAMANRVAAQANLDKAKVDVTVAEARAEVARTEQERLRALTGYLTLSAPFDGIIVARNANTGDFVLPATGDPSAAPRSRDLSPTRASPIFVVARTDLVRIYVDVSETDSINIVSRVDKDAGVERPITQGQVRVFALNNEEFPVEATRSSWALNFQSRTLRVEIDLPNKNAQLLPGMYAYAHLNVIRPDVRALPFASVIEIGNQFGCYVVVNGKAVWTPLVTGVNDGKWIEVQQKLVDGQWKPFDGSEQVAVSNLDELHDGATVQVQ